MTAQRPFFEHIFIFALPFIIFVLTYCILFYAYQPQSVICPHVVGKDCFTALKELSACNLHIKILHLQEDEQRPNGTITAQIPHPGQQIKEKQTVYLTVCQQPQRIGFPCLIGLDKEAIHQQLQELGYEGDLCMLNYATGPDQCCFAQWPTQSDDVQQHIITVHIAQHPPHLVLWPHLVGLELTQAQEILARHGIQAMIRGKQQPNKPAYVSSQMPLSGSIIDLSSNDLRAELSITAKPPQA